LHAKSENSNNERLAATWVEVNIGNLREDYTLFVRFCRLTSGVLPRTAGSLFWTWQGWTGQMQGRNRGMDGSS
jgi:hypothetical protein